MVQIDQFTEFAASNDPSPIQKIRLRHRLAYFSMISEDFLLSALGALCIPVRLPVAQRYEGHYGLMSNRSMPTMHGSRALDIHKSQGLDVIMASSTGIMLDTFKATDLSHTSFKISSSRGHISLKLLHTTIEEDDQSMPDQIMGGS